MFSVNYISEYLEAMDFSSIKFIEKCEGDYYFEVFDNMDNAYCRIKISHNGFIFVRYEDNSNWGESIGRIE